MVNGSLGYELSNFVDLEGAGLGIHFGAVRGRCSCSECPANAFATHSYSGTACERRGTEKTGHSREIRWCECPAKLETKPENLNLLRWLGKQKDGMEGLIPVDDPLIFS